MPCNLSNGLEMCLCPSCSAVRGACWPRSWFHAWRGGDLKDYQVIKIFERSRTQDFSDTMGRFSPTPEDLRDHFIPKKKFIQSCSFDSRGCSSESIYAWTSDKYGICYTFNSVFVQEEYKNETLSTPISSKPKETASFGPANGLRLTLNIAYEQYIALLSPDIGARVIVHSPRQLPFPEDEGFNVAPGRSISIAIQRKNIKRVGHPHGNCRSQTGSKIFREYSAIRCKKLCLENVFWRLCGCYDGLSPAYNESVTVRKPKLYCSPFNVSQGKTLSIFLTHLQPIRLAFSKLS
ncbi:hypothetical protein SK128_014299 [Halocaridina rubra]|uniref:Uncharacterized protein n=1 Tax=Halocaridina rubra TaxID=373956 RepID=A0AAN8WW16_HALRR